MSPDKYVIIKYFVYCKDMMNLALLKKINCRIAEQA